MSTLYVISNETGKIVAVISGSDDDKCHAKFMDEYGSNDYTYSFNDRGATYAKKVVEIDLDEEE